MIIYSDGGTYSIDLHWTETTVPIFRVKCCGGLLGHTATLADAKLMLAGRNKQKDIREIEGWSQRGERQ